MADTNFKQYRRKISPVTNEATDFDDFQRKRPQPRNRDQEESYETWEQISDEEKFGGFFPKKSHDPKRNGPPPNYPKQNQNRKKFSQNPPNSQHPTQQNQPQRNPNKKHPQHNATQNPPPPKECQPSPEQLKEFEKLQEHLKNCGINWASEPKPPEKAELPLAQFDPDMRELLSRLENQTLFDADSKPQDSDKPFQPIAEDKKSEKKKKSNKKGSNKHKNKGNQKYKHELDMLNNPPDFFAKESFDSLQHAGSKPPKKGNHPPPGIGPTVDMLNHLGGDFPLGPNIGNLPLGSPLSHGPGLSPGMGKSAANFGGLPPMPPLNQMQMMPPMAPLGGMGMIGSMGPMGQMGQMMPPPMNQMYPMHQMGQIGPGYMMGQMSNPMLGAPVFGNPMSSPPMHGNSMKNTSDLPPPFLNPQNMGHAGAPGLPMGHFPMERQGPPPYGMFQDFHGSFEFEPPRNMAKGRKQNNQNLPMGMMGTNPNFQNLSMGQHLDADAWNDDIFNEMSPINGMTQFQPTFEQPLPTQPKPAKKKLNLNSKPFDPTAVSYD